MKNTYQDAPQSSLSRVEGPSLVGATGWLNSQPLTLPALRGKVVAVEFMTFTCVNWLRTLPYARDWAEKYKGDGLVVVGVQSPEFGFEHDAANVRRAMMDLKVDYPIAIDNDFAIWRSFGNEYWPALYLIDAQGRVRYKHVGEGNHEQSEAAIKSLLAEAGFRDVEKRRSTVVAAGVEAPADWKHLMSQEAYLGSSRAENFSSPEAAIPGRATSFTIPPHLGLNHWALGGRWDVQSDRVESTSSSGKIAFRFHARDVNLVLTRLSDSGSVRFRVLIDGEPPGASHGIDADQSGDGEVVAPRLYQLVRQTSTISDRTFEIQFLDPGVAAYVFTFG